MCKFKFKLRLMLDAVQVWHAELVHFCLSGVSVRLPGFGQKGGYAGCKRLDITWV